PRWRRPFSGLCVTYSVIVLPTARSDKVQATEVVRSMNDLLTTAIGLHQSGQRGPAAPLYQKILVQQQDNASALHLLGVLHNQQGQRARAVEEKGGHQ